MCSKGCWGKGKQAWKGWGFCYPINFYSPGDSPDRSRAWAESKEETTLTACAGIPVAAVEEEMVDFFGGTTTLLQKTKSGQKPPCEGSHVI